MSRDITAIPPVKANERVRYGSEPSQFYDLFRPRVAQTAAVMIHGGYWRARYNLEHASHLCAALARNGIATASLEYRRVGEAGGGWPGSFADVQAGFAAAQRKFRRPPVVLGHSAGGQLALMLAVASQEMTGVVALAPVADLQMACDLHLSHDAVVEFLGGTPRQLPNVYEAADPARNSSTVRRLVLHGTRDQDVPLALSESFVNARKRDKGKVELLVVKGADHFDLIDPEAEAFGKVLEAVKALA